AAGQSDIPGGLVGDAELQHSGLARRDHVQRLGDDRALDAAAGDRPQERAVIVDDEAGARGPRRRAPGLNHRGQRHAVTGLLPVLGGFQDILVAVEHETLFQAAERIRLRWCGGSADDKALISPSIELKLCTGRNSSTCGSIILMPWALASKPP